MFNPQSYKRNKFQPAETMWKYMCESSMTEIVSDLFLGSREAVHSECLPYLKEKGIRYFLCVRDPSEVNLKDALTEDPHVVVLTLIIQNLVTENIIRFFNKANTFIDQALSSMSPVLVYGSTGNSRSASLVTAYIMQRLQWSASDTLSYIVQKRGSVHINEAFKWQLIEYQSIYKSMRGGGPSQDQFSAVRRKRARDDDDDDDASLRKISINNSVLDLSIHSVIH